MPWGHLKKSSDVICEANYFFFSLQTPFNNYIILFLVSQFWLSVQATENNRFVMFDKEEISSFTSYVCESINRSFSWARFIIREFSHMSEYLFMLKEESIDQIQARELNYLIFLFDNDL